MGLCVFIGSDFPPSEAYRGGCGEALARTEGNRCPVPWIKLSLITVMRILPPTAEKLPTAGSWFILPRMDDKHRKAEKETSLYTEKEAVSGLKEKLPAIDTFPNQFPDYEITIEVPEFTSVCPRTGLPDFGVLTIRYVPDKLCLELKSLKMYLLAYRNLGIFYENAVNRILEDIVGACRPVRASVKGEFNPRGGMRSKVEVCFPREKGKGQGSS